MIEKEGYNKERSEMYERAISKYPLARIEDIAAMHEHLNPRKGEKILGIGEGNGYFCKAILEAVEKTGKYVVTEPSNFQLENLIERTGNPSNLATINAAAEDLDLQPQSIDKMWSFGAMHHCDKQEEAFKRMYAALKKRGRLVICDVFQGSVLADHFDEQVARYSCTGHNVKFLSEKIARSLCYLAGFKDANVTIEDLLLKWHFQTERDIGRFIYLLHGMSKVPKKPEEEKYQFVLEGCKRILGVTRNEDSYALNWPMKVLKATK